MQNKVLVVSFQLKWEFYKTVVELAFHLEGGLQGMVVKVSREIYKIKDFGQKSTYSCNNITTTLIQISRLFYFGFFSKTNHQMMI